MSAVSGTSSLSETTGVASLLLNTLRAGRTFSYTSAHHICLSVTTNAAACGPGCKQFMAQVVMLNIASDTCPPLYMSIMSADTTSR